ncbi:MAG: NADH-ubiquinone oxidoreductase-F iron-sulfur binding region domain-containing protein [Candidatus Gottesmanbacteria bacterium]
MEQQSPETLLLKIEQAKLVGRGGSGYSTAVKWQEMFNKHHDSIYMAVNGSEGEPGTLKDGYILKNHLTELLNGIAVAYTIFPQTKTIYLYLRKDYFDTYEKTITEEVKKLFPTLPLVVFKEPGGYLCGENTVLVNAIEQKRLEPRRKPPYISNKGIYDKPTIVNNLETFYQVGQIAQGKYNDTRLYSITGDISNPGVYDASNSITVSELLIQTNNDFPGDGFIQLGGGASGMYVTKNEILNTPANRGTGALLVYSASKHPFLQFLHEKLQFLIKENCGKCTPCREGIYRLHEMTKQGIYNKELFHDIAVTLAKTSFCGLGVGAGTAILSLLNKKETIWKQ